MLAPNLNRAAELGPSAYPWWPDWRGKAVAIIASGPSAKTSSIERLAGRCPVIAIKQSFELAKFADVVYGCDFPWWAYRKGLPEFRGLKLGFDPQVKSLGVTPIKIGRTKEVMHGRVRERGYSDDILTAEPGVIGGGRNSGFQALNLAVQFGAARILLVGYDMTCGKHKHWYGANQWERANNPTDHWFERDVIPHMERAIATIAKIGVEITTTSPYGRLSIKRVDVEGFIS
jgi:hypothetical protein